MDLFDQVSEDIKNAMKAKDKVALETLRNIKKFFLEAKTAPGANDILTDDAALKIIQKLVKQGKTRYIGISNCFAWQLAQANDLARERNLTPFVSVQNHYNLIFREEEREMLPYCQKEGMAYTPYSSLASGRLARLTAD